jgi:hypothetical protein
MITSERIIPVRVIEAFVDQLDMREMGFEFG